MYYIDHCKEGVKVRGRLSMGLILTMPPSLAKRRAGIGLDLERMHMRGIDPGVMFRGLA